MLSVATFRQRLILAAVIGTGALALFAWSWTPERGGHQSDRVRTSEARDALGEVERTVQRPLNEADRGTPSPRLPSPFPTPAPDDEGSLVTGKVRPHPDSPERNALLQQRSVMERAKAAASSGDIEALRQILDEPRMESVGGAFDDWFEAYRVILGCLEANGSQSQDRARRFVDEEGGSTMRRDVRRYCSL